MRPGIERRSPGPLANEPVSALLFDSNWKENSLIHNIPKEMETAWSWTWTRFTESISYVDNHYTMSAS